MINKILITKNYIIRLKQYIFYFLLCLCFTFTFSSCSNSSANSVNLAELGNKYFVKHNYGEALKIYEEAIKKGYKSLDVFYNSGFIYHYEKKDLKKAEELYKRGLLMYPNVEVLHSALSQLYFEIDNLTEAVKEYKLAVKLTKVPLRINANKARELLKHQGKNEQEIYNFFIEIIKYNPKDSYALYEVAEHEKNHGRYKEALEKYKRIIEFNPNMRDEIVRDMGTCYYKLGDYKLALPYFEEAKKNGDYVPEELLEEIKSKIGAS